MSQTTMRLSRRAMLAATSASGLSIAGARWNVFAQGATPAAESATPGFALVRVRKLPTPELNQAIYPDVMRTFLPATAAVPGFFGYLFAFDGADPTASLTFTIVSDETAAEAAGEVARDYVEQLDPRFVVETPIAAQGAIRVYETTDTPASSLPPFLNGCALTIRHRVNAEGVVADDVVPEASELALQLKEMPGFILYCWIETETGRSVINIWETEEHLQAGNQAVADFVAANTADTTVGEAVVNEGPIGYAEITGLTR